MMKKEHEVPADVISVLEGIREAGYRIKDYRYRVRDCDGYVLVKVWHLGDEEKLRRIFEGDSVIVNGRIIKIAWVDC